MSQENVEIVRRGLQSLEAFLGNARRVRRLGPPRAIRSWTFDGVYVGRDAVVKACRHYFGTWDDYRLDAEELIDAGSSVVVACCMSEAVERAAALPSSSDSAQVWTFSRGRIVRWEIFPNRARRSRSRGAVGARRSHADS